MPSPVKPSQICATVPTATSALCDRIQAVLLRLPRLLCDYFSWMLNEDGTLTDAFIREVAALPVGMVIWRPSTSVPAGWLACDGSEVSRAVYAPLFAVIGTRFGAGNTTTTFNLPNGKRRCLVGYDPTGGAAFDIAASGGEETHVLTVTELPAHTHPFTPEVSGDSSPVSTTRITAGNANQTYGDGSYVTDSTGSDGAHNNMQPHLVGMFLIKT